MDQSELLHTWRVAEDSRLLRFYLWAWGADASSVTFCSMFWGYVFAPLAVLARLLLPLRWLLLKVVAADERKRARRKAMNAERFEHALKEPPPPRDPAPGRIADFFARPWPRRVAKWVGLALLWLVGAALIACAGFAVFWIATHLADIGDAIADGVYEAQHWFLHTNAWKVAVAAGGGGLAAAIVFGPGVRSAIVLERRMRKRRDRKHEAGELTLGDVIVHGAKAVKMNTCPRIEVRESEPEEASS